jgi:SAM-dependent methyltransferase
LPKGRPVTTPSFPSRDSAQVDFWEERFRAGFTPWDAGAAPPALLRWLATEPARGRRALIAGCGAAYEAIAFDAAGYLVLAIDYAPQAIARAAQLLGPQRARRCLRQADFFSFEAGPFDLLYERAFLAALPPRLWRRWAHRCAELLRPGGALVGFFLLDPAAGAPRRGPPFAILRRELDDLLGTDLECVDDVDVPAGESIAAFAGRERFMRWRRR